MCGTCAVGAYETVRTPSGGWVVTEIARYGLAEMLGWFGRAIDHLRGDDDQVRRATRGPLRTALLLAFALLLPIVAVVATPGTASATLLQTTVLSPVTGHVSSNPDEPHWRPYDGDYSFDVHTSRTKRPVYARFRNTNGSLTLTVAQVARACRSGNFNDGGNKIVLNVNINGSKVGTVTYSHLTSIRYSSGNVPVGAHIGDVATAADGLSSSSCWGGPHVHVEPRNDRSYGCFFRQPLGTAVGATTPLGLVGGERASTVNRLCPSGAETTTPTPQPPPPPPPPPTTPAWDARFISQNAWLDEARTQPWDISRAHPTQSGWLEFRAMNTGTKAWTPTGTNPVRIGTAQPRDRSSAFRPATGWWSANRPAALNQPMIPPGSIGTFVFPVTVPAGGTTVREHFQLVADGAAWFGPVMWRDFSRPAWSATTLDVVTSRDRTGTESWDPAQSVTGETGWVRLRVRNTGSATWSASGTNPVLLGTSEPNDRHSLFATSSWINEGRAAAVSPSTVPPGSVGTFLFPMRMPSDPGTWTESFRVVAERASWLTAGTTLTIATRRPAVSDQRPPAPTHPTPADPISTTTDLELISPIRLVDTRSQNATIDGHSSGDGPIAAGGTLEFDTLGRDGVSPAATATVLNVTAIGATAGGYLTVWPCGTDRPTASTLNVDAGETRANTVVAKPGTDGRVCIFSSTQAHVVVDVTGTLPMGSSVIPLTPARLVDSRSADATIDGRQSGHGTHRAESTFAIEVAGRGGVPVDAHTALLNVTVVGARGPGFASVWPCGGNQPVASNLNFTTGSVMANSVVSGIADDGTVCVHTSDATDVLVDVVGHVSGPSSISPIAPERLVESRMPSGTIDGDHSGSGPITGGRTIEINVAGRGSVSSSATGAVVNVTAIRPNADGFITVFPCGGDMPLASSLNYAAGDVVPNGVYTALGDRGTLCLYSSATTDLIIDVTAVVDGS